MIIDFHTHCFPDKLAPRAMEKLAPDCGARTAFFDGTADGLLGVMDADGVDAAVVLHIATNPRQQRSVNDFAIELAAQHPRLICFGSVHPEAPDALAELRRLRDAGIKGIKLHPDYQEFFVNEPRVFPIYREAARLGLITVFHAGVDIGYPEPIHCMPAALAEALPQFGGAPVVAAHWGGYMCWDEVLRHLCGRDIYLDSSYSARRMPPPWARKILEAHGAERVFLGSDLPWASPADEIYFLRQLGASEGELQAMLGSSAAALLGLIG